MIPQRIHADSKALPTKRKAHPHLWAVPMQRGKPPHQRKIKSPLIRLETSWTPDDVLDARDMHLRGRFEQSGLLWVWMLCTSRLKVVLGKRVSALAAIPVTVAPSRDLKIASPAEKAVAKLWESRWPRILPEATRQELHRNAIGMGAALARVSWELCEDGRWWPKLTAWPTDAYYYDDTDCHWYAKTREGADRKIKPGYGWILWLPYGPKGFQLGAVASLGMECLLATMSKQDWANYNKANATAVKKAIVPRGMPAAEKSDYLDQVEEVGEGENTTILCPQNLDGSGANFEYVTTEGASKVDTFEKAKADAEKTITIEILGQEKTTDDGGVGTYDAVEALQGVEDRIILGDGESLTEVLYAQLSVPWAEYNFGNASLAPWVKWQPKGTNETLEAAPKLKSLAESVVAMDAALQGTDRQVDKVSIFEDAGIKTIPRPPVAPAPAAEPTPMPEPTPVPVPTPETITAYRLRHTPAPIAHTYRVIEDN